MNRLRLLTLISVLFLCAIAGTLMSTQGCKGPGALETPQRAWIDASRSTYNVIGARFKAYVNTDPALDPATRDSLAHTVDDWDFMIRQAELAVPAPTPPPVPAPPATGGAQ